MVSGQGADRLSRVTDPFDRCCGTESSPGCSSSVSYVVNIGFSRSWKKRPAFASVALLLGAASVNYLSSGAVEGHLSAMVLHSWLLYVFGHLGLAFLLSAIIGTPGCEMRAFHHLYSLMTGRPTKEHHCPVGPLRPIDQWEAARR